VNVDYWLPDSEERDHKLSDIPSPTDMAKAIQRVRELHKKIPARNSDLEYTCEECYAFYSHYEYEYPCLTIQALDGDV
jgi:neutral trehalase